LPITPPADPAAAFDLGASVGADPSRTAGDCPYDHGSLALRTRWMDGFSEARREFGTAATRTEKSQPAG